MPCQPITKFIPTLLPERSGQHPVVAPSQVFAHKRDPFCLVKCALLGRTGIPPADDAPLDGIEAQQASGPMPFHAPNRRSLFRQHETAAVCFRYARALICAGLVLLGSTKSRAQAPPAPSPFRTVNLNYVYAADLGFGGYSLDGLTAQVYTLPLSYSLHGSLPDDWTLRLLAPVQAGLYALDVTDTNSARIKINQQSLGIVPGAELQIPIGSRTVVKPFAQFGVVDTFGQDVGNPWAYVFLGGARAITQWHVGETTFSLGNAVIYAGDQTIGSGFSEHYVSLQVGGEVRHPLGFRVANLEPDLGVYATYYYYPAPLHFSRFLRPALKVENQIELGFSVGSASPFQFQWLSNPRIGAGVVFGGGLSVWHINFGFPF
jgi:hypothetical protein